jgi:signal transduction histidine kinase
MSENVVIRLWDNPELKRVGLGIGAVSLVFALLGLFLWQLTLNGVHRQGIERQLSVIGQLASRHPELELDVAQAFVSEASPQEYAAGIQAAGKFGYDADLPVRFNSDMERLLRNVAAGIVAAAVLFGMSLFLLVTHAFRSVYRKAAQCADLAERIVEGDFHTEPERPAEGIFSKLAHQFQLMAGRLQLTLERLQAEKEGMKRLLTDISHQLKTPLAALQMFVELAQEEELDSGKRRDFLAKSESQIERMDWLIRQLLTVARVEAGAARLTKTECPLIPTVLEAVESLKPKALQRHVELVQHYDETRKHLLLHDPAWLGESIGNIVKNGIEHTPEGGKVEITVEETSVLLRIHIRDTGSGIPEAELPRVFERFYKGSGSTPSGGAGIGLSLAKAIIEQHDGFIAVRSTPGKGTVFTITLPLKLTKS